MHCAEILTSHIYASYDWCMDAWKPLRLQVQGSAHSCAKESIHQANEYAVKSKSHTLFATFMR